MLDKSRTAKEVEKKRKSRSQHDEGRQLFRLHGALVSYLHIRMR